MSAVCIQRCNEAQHVNLKSNCLKKQLKLDLDALLVDQLEPS